MALDYDIFWQGVERAVLQPRMLPLTFALDTFSDQFYKSNAKLGNKSYFQKIVVLLSEKNALGYLSIGNLFKSQSKRVKWYGRPSSPGLQGNTTSCSCAKSWNEIEKLEFVCEVCNDSVLNACYKYSSSSEFEFLSPIYGTCTKVLPTESKLLAC